MEFKEIYGNIGGKNKYDFMDFFVRKSGIVERAALDEELLLTTNH